MKTISATDTLIPLPRDGRGIAGVVSYYTISGYAEGVEAGKGLWYRTMMTPTAEHPYLWTYEEITYTDGEKERTIPHIIGFHSTSGSDAYALDLDNEVEGIPCTATGTPKGSVPLATCNARVYRGSAVESGWTFTAETTGCTASVGRTTGSIAVTGITAERGSVRVTATKDGRSLTSTMNLYKVMPGNEGVSPTVYSIETGVSAISRAKDGTLTPESVSLYKRKTTGSTTVLTSEKKLMILREGQDTAESELMGTGGTAGGIASGCTAVVATLYDTDGKTMLDRERIPIVSDGKDGDDAEFFELISTNNDIHVDSSGNATPTRVSVLAYRIRGTKREALATDATSSKYVIVTEGTGIAKALYTTGKAISSATLVSHTPARFDLLLRSSLKAGNTYANEDILATLPVTVSRDGKDGGAGAFTSVAFKRSDSSLADETPEGGTYEAPVPTLPYGWEDAPPPGTDPLWISKARFTVEMDGKDGSPEPSWTKATPAADSTDIEFIWSSLENPGAPTEGKHPYPEGDSSWSKDPEDAVWMGVALKSNGAWGAWQTARVRGEAGVTIQVTPENVEFKKGGGVQRAKVSVRMYRGKDHLSYNGNCSTLTPAGSSRLITTGLLWNFGTDTEGSFHYELTYSGASDINMDIPFTVTIDGVRYPRQMHVTTISDGSEGKAGLMAYPAGKYSRETGYTAENDASPVVMHGSNYYLLRAGATYRGADEPTDRDDPAKEYAKMGRKESRWLLMETINYLFANIVMSDFAKMASAVFFGDWLISQQGIRNGTASEEYEHFKDGSFEPTLALNFRTGEIRSRNSDISGIMHIGGNSTFRGLALHEKFTVTKENYGSLIKKVNTYEDTYVDQIDLINMGSFVEFKSIPAGADLDYINLPAIRTGLAYTDAYRDSVRQFIGSEVAIYNSCGKTLRIDTGENTVSVATDMACHFRMVFAAERMNSGGRLLERIKWEWSEPFQF